MNRYLILLICFIISLCIIEYDKTDYYINNNRDNESILVFNEIEDSGDVLNPDTSDLNILFIFIICVYSFIFLFMLVKDIRILKKYCDVIIN